MIESKLVENVDYYIKSDNVIQIGKEVAKIINKSLKYNLIIDLSLFGCKAFDNTMNKLSNNLGYFPNNSICYFYGS